MINSDYKSNMSFKWRGWIFG